MRENLMAVLVTKVQTLTHVIKQFKWDSSIGVSFEEFSRLRNRCKSEKNTKNTGTKKHFSDFLTIVYFFVDNLQKYSLKVLILMWAANVQNTLKYEQFIISETKPTNKAILRLKLKSLVEKI